MINKKRGQISTEYLMIVSFVVFFIIVVSGIAFFYASEIRETIKFRQIESFSNKTTSLAESVYFSGEPSRTTMTGYLPEGVVNIEISGNDIIYDVSAIGGEAKIAYSSSVALEGNITTNSGVKKLYLTARTNDVMISETGFEE